MNRDWEIIFAVGTVTLSKKKLPTPMIARAVDDSVSNNTSKTRNLESLRSAQIFFPPSLHTGPVQ